MEFREIFGALARCHHGKTGGARPVDHLGDEGGLVAVGHRIDDARGPRLGGQQGPGEHVGLDVDHDDRFAGLDRSERMGDPGGGCARRLDHDLDAISGAGVDAAIDEAGARDPLSVPADPPAGLLGPGRIEVGDHRHFQTRDGRHLGEEHRAELAGADQADPDRPPALSPGGELAHQVHGYSAATLWLRAYCSSASGADARIGVKSRCAIQGSRLNLVMWFETAHSVR
jgi:hypothetical protein